MKTETKAVLLVSAVCRLYFLDSLVAIDMAQNRPLWRLCRCQALRNLELHARNDDDDDNNYLSLLIMFQQLVLHLDVVCTVGCYKSAYVDRQRTGESVNIVIVY